MADSGHDDDDLELESEGNAGLTQSPSVRKNIPLKLKGKGRGRRGVRTKKVLTRKGIIEEEEEDDLDEGKDSISLDSKFELEDDLSKLEMPSFTTLERGPPEPLHQSKTLKWNHKVNLIGEKVVNPMIHCCEKCSLPILIYGRMIPCKHVFCSDCANKAEKHCPRCKDPVQRVEHSALGTVFICSFGGPRHGVGGCKRSYLSQRDLQAHIGHRHLRPPSNPPGSNSTNSSSSANSIVLTPSQTAGHNLVGRDPRATHTPLPSEVAPVTARTPPHSQQHHLPEYRDPPDPVRPPSILPAPPPTQAVTSNVPQRHPFTHPAAAHGPSSYSPIPVVSTRSNLITVPIQDDSGTASPSPHIHPQPHLSPYASPSTHPPPIPVNPYPQPTHHYQPVLPNPPYSQAPQTFNPPPAHIPPPSIHNPNPPIYSQHNPLPPYNTQPVSYPPPSWASGPPPRAHGPRPMGPHLNQPCGPSDPGYRPPYYP